jgi:hypothetical protein
VLVQKEPKKEFLVNPKYIIISIISHHGPKKKYAPSFLLSPFTASPQGKRPLDRYRLFEWVYSL